ncbi:uncharacterized protein LOC128869172 [Anastrepha ludens]|uniref:uncharacterized protein LOC128869172 n=1 Tax=Anastrepha ludens TaxID=28586 RepID=UPI0023AFE68F|nr:uncharacterized protein LOC128869172 [Anastrepha ludens]
MAEHDIGAFLSDLEDDASGDCDANFVLEEDECLSSEQSISSGTEAFTSLTVTNSTELFDKNRLIKWTTIPSLQCLSRAASENILYGKSGVTSYVIHRISKIRDTFDLCLTEALKSYIIHYSNLQGSAVFENFPAVDATEFDAYLIFLYLWESTGHTVKVLTSCGTSFMDVRF